MRGAVGGGEDGGRAVGEVRGSCLRCVVCEKMFTKV